MNKKLYIVVCILVTASLSLLNITYAANATVNAATDTATQAKTSNTGAIVGGVVAATAVVGGIAPAVISNTKNKDSSSSGDNDTPTTAHLSLTVASTIRLQQFHSRHCRT